MEVNSVNIAGAAEAERVFTIEEYHRCDDIYSYFFKIDGVTRRSSYDKKEISDFARGYTGRKIAIVRMN
jgi:hypothetical protein